MRMFIIMLAAVFALTISASAGDKCCAKKSEAKAVSCVMADGKCSCDVSCTCKDADGNCTCKDACKCKAAKCGDGKCACTDCKKCCGDNCTCASGKCADKCKDKCKDSCKK